jgi:ATP-dependent RNA circularization protein (DNA/RNA ligase family)
MTTEHLSSYPSIYALGHRYITDLFDGPVTVEEKIDGSQFSMARINGELVCRSKGQQIVVSAPEKMFAAAVETAQKLDLHDGWVYRCEYLKSPKHNTLAYSRIPVNHLILFDVMTGYETYLTPNEKGAEAVRLGLESVPCYLYCHCTQENALEFIRKCMDLDSILGGCKIEGVVVKNYARFGTDKKILIGKFVSEAFKEKHPHAWKVSNPGPADVVLQHIISELKTEARFRKAVQHLRDAGKLTGTPTDIGPLLVELASDTEREESDAIKETLYKHFWPQIRRGISAGFPEFYKREIGIVE